MLGFIRKSTESSPFQFMNMVAVWYGKRKCYAPYRKEARKVVDYITLIRLFICLLRPHVL